TDKANIEMEAFQSGVLRKILAKEGETVPVGNAIAELETAGAGPQLEAPERIEPIGEQPPQEAIPSAKVTPESMEEKHVPRAEVFEETHILASPLAKRMAQELGIDLSKVKGTGPNGRITEADVVAYASQVEAAAPPIPSEAPTPKITEAPAVAEIPSEERELNKMRKTLAHRMT
ncbi:MAG: E3 binding domain-containing protein, partial [Armatimonadota bacterium]|nr:E3 binding domain-containing protein [Armatimonadota bacterium]